MNFLDMGISFLVGEARLGLEEWADDPEKSKTGCLTRTVYRGRLYFSRLFIQDMSPKSIPRGDYSAVVT
jgi:hypothetical protein